MISPKIEILDSLRAFAAVSVCFYHFVCTTTDYIHTSWILNTFHIGQYGVQLFFVISGFVIPWAMFHGGYELKNFFQFFVKRLARLEPPYLFSIILVLAVYFAREKFLGKENSHMEVSATQVLLHLGYLIPFADGYKWLNNVYWTLAIEFQYYLLMALLFVPLVRSGIIFRIITYTAIAGLTFICPEGFLFHWLPLFLLGILLFLFKARIIKVNEYYTTTALLLAFCLYKFPVAAVIYSCIPIVCVLYWSNIKIPLLHFIGKFSYSIYLIHPILGASLINILSHKFTSPLQKIMVIAAGTIFTLISAWVTYQLIERPSRNLSSSIKYKK